MTVDLTNWTALLVALSPLLIAVLRSDTMSDNVVSLMTVAVVAFLFFCGRALDGVLTWPMDPALAGQLAAALVAQQGLYQLLRKTSAITLLERFGKDEVS